MAFTGVFVQGDCRNPDVDDAKWIVPFPGDRCEGEGKLGFCSNSKY